MYLPINISKIIAIIFINVQNKAKAMSGGENKWGKEQIEKYQSEVRIHL